MKKYKISLSTGLDFKFENDIDFDQTFEEEESEQENLYEEVLKLKELLTKRYFNRDDLLYVECASIEREYLLECGALEYNAYKAEIEYRRLKRKIDLVRAKINRQEKVDEEKIEIELDAEFYSYQQSLKKQIEKLAEKIREKQGQRLTKEEVRQLKKMYIEIIKKLHPDANPNQSSEMLELYKRAVQAYKKHDAQALELIYTIVKNIDTNLIFDDEDYLLNEKERLLDAIQAVDQEIEHIKKSYPYLYRSILISEEKIEKRKEYLINVERKYLEAIEKLKQTLAEMLDAYEG